MKRGTRIVLALIVLLFLLGAGARWYLTSRPLANSVRSQIAELYGGEVKLDGVDIWVGRSSFTGLQFFEKDCPDDEPWLSVQNIETDLSVFDLLGGRYLPGQVDLEGARVLLRFDADGNLITCLPDELFAPHDPETTGLIETLPRVNLRRSQITLRKPDGDLVLENIDAALQQEEDRFVLTGSVEGLGWGKWTLAGHAVQGGSKVQVTLTSEEEVHVTNEMVDRIPFLSPDVTDAVRIHGGKSTGRIEFKYDLEDQKLRYRIDLRPRETDLTVPAIELRASGAQGKVTIEDGLIELRDVRGTAFEGTLRMDADLDFRDDVTRLQFDRLEAVDGQGLKVEQFPKSWKFPPKISGRLEGSATLQVSIIPETPESKGRVLTEGAGKGRIVDAKVAGRPTDQPIGLELHPVPGGFGFGVKGTDSSRIDPADLDALAAFLVASACRVPGGERHAGAFGCSSAIGDWRSQG